MQLEGSLDLERRRPARWVPIVAIVIPVVICVAAATWFIRAFIAPQEVVIQDNLANDSIVGWEQPAEWGFADWDGLVERLKRGDPKLLAA